MPSEHAPQLDTPSFTQFRYLRIAISSAWLWDLMISISAEVHTLFWRRISLVDVIYILSRSITLAVVIAHIPFVVIPYSSEKCNALLHVGITALMIASMLNTVLLLVRVRAIFAHSKRVKTFFFVIWIITALSLLVMPFTFHGASAYPTGLCVMARTCKLSVVAPLSIYTFTTIAFISIYLRLASMVWSGKRSWPTLFLSSERGPISKTMIQNRAIYFTPMLAVIVFLLVLEYSMALHDDVLAQWQGALIFALAVFYNTVTSKSFRLLRLASPLETDSPDQQRPAVRFCNLSIDDASHRCEGTPM